MSRVLKNLLGLKASPASLENPAAPAHVPYRANSSAPPLSKPFVIAALGITAIIMVIAASRFFSGANRDVASIANSAPAISDKELFLRNRQAVMGFYNGNLEAAATELRKLISAMKPADAALLANLGAILLRQGKFTESRTAFVQALAHAPRSSAALNGLGQLALRENELDEAQENFRLALQEAPNRPETLLSLGQIAELKGEWDTAKAHYANFLRSGAEPKLKAQITDRLRRIDGRAPKEGGAV